MKTPVIHVSNSGEALITLLRDQLFFSSSSPFSKKLIFLPHLSLKTPLMTRFVEGSKLDIVLGLEFLELGAGIQTLFQWSTGKRLLFPPQDLLALHIESLLEEENPSFATALAAEFLKYGKFGGAPLSGWKKELWEKIFSKWNYPYQLLETPLKKNPLSLEVHLFNFPFLPKLYHLFFAKLALCFPIHYYQFSPCQEFWSDGMTDREKMHLVKKDPKVAPYLESGPPLLANFGKLGRETFRVFEEDDFMLEEHYCLIEPKTALSKIQHGVLNFQRSIPDQDSSIRLFPLSSKLREVEVLYQTLLEMDVLPSDVQIFALNISDYAPFIEHVFGVDDSPFDFTIRDLSGHSFLESFFDLFSLERFEVSSVFRLFSSPYFSPLSSKEVQTFASWIEKTSVKWGMDAEHRKRLLPGYLEEEGATWEQAFRHLLDNLVFLPENPSSWDLPYLDFSDAELLGKCITLMRTLRQDLDFLEEARLTLSDWADHLHQLFERYFIIPEEETHSYQLFEEKLQMLRELGRINEGSYVFSSIKRYISCSLKEKKGVRFSKQVEALTFRSLKLGAVLSSKVIALLGMNEGAFPRPYIRSSLSLLDNQSDFSPHPSDEDRYLFLEALLSAKETLLLFYQNVSEEDGKEQPPSILIQELNLTPEIHPTFPFHHHYFTEGNTAPQYQYERAQNFYKPKQPIPFIPEFVIPTLLPQPSEEFLSIDVAHLLRFAKNPLRFYCNHVLNLYFQYEDKTDEEFQLSPLKRYQLFQDTFEEADLRGHLPLGRFKEVALRRVEEESPPDWIPIDLTLENFRIQGSIEVPNLEEKKLVERLKNYPLILLYTEAHVPLLRYLRYYQIALQTPSPFHPLWGETLLKEEGNAFEKKVAATSLDPYLEATLIHANSQVIFETWAPLLRATFAELL